MPIESIAQVEDISQLATRDLVVRACQLSGRVALDEFHSRRTVFIWREGGGRLLLLAQYLDRRRRAAPSVSSDVAARAYDLTLGKFISLPTDGGDTSDQGAADVGRRRCSPPNVVDCRRYFAAYLKYVDMVLAERGSVSPLEEERISARALQSFVDRQFELSLRDARRRANPAVSRYFWRVNGSGFLLSFPRSVAGHDRRRWLEANVPDPDPHVPGQQHHIQNLINSTFSVGESLCPTISLAVMDLPDTREDQLSLAAERVTEIGLGKAVAAEKAASVDSQRPAVRRLGPKRLASLITEVFEALADGQLADNQMARRFGLSKATYSRFAGSCWTTSDGGDVVPTAIPDLWRNTARVLGRNPLFRETAERAGVWPRVEAVLTATQKG